MWDWILEEYQEKLANLTKEEIKQMQEDFDSQDDSCYEVPDNIIIVGGMIK